MKFDRQLFKEAFKAGYKAGMIKLNEKEEDYNWAADEYGPETPYYEKCSVYLLPVYYIFEADVDNEVLAGGDKKAITKYITNKCIPEYVQLNDEYVATFGNNSPWEVRHYYEPFVETIEPSGDNKVLINFYAYHAGWCSTYEVEEEDFIKDMEMSEAEFNKKFKLKCSKLANKCNIKVVSAEMWLGDVSYMGEHTD